MTFTYHDLDFCQVLPGESRPDRAALVRFASPDEAKWIVERVFPADFDFGDLRSRLTGVLRLPSSLCQVSGESLGLPGPITVPSA